MDREVPPSLVRSHGFEHGPSRGHIGALAAALQALEPDVRLLAVRVQAVLRHVEQSIPSEGADESFEDAWTSTGAAALYDVTAELAETLSAAVDRLDASARPDAKR